MSSSPRPPRSPWQLLYAAAHRLRRRWWAERSVRLPRPVISIGNLHWGGTGKTPAVIAVAAHLRDAGWRVAVLSRGYGRKSRGIHVVSRGGWTSAARGEGPLLGPTTAGDEPVLMAAELPGVAVVVGAKRDRAGEQALERLDPPPDLFLLDDGFSHLRLARDLDLLALPADDPFGGGRLLPSGRLREPLAASARADAVLLTGDATPSVAREVARELRPFGFAGPGFAAPTRVLPPRVVEDPRQEAGPRRGQAFGVLGAEERVLLVSGIARPERFTRAAMRAAGQIGFTIVVELRLGDHDPYAEKTLERIRSEFRKRDATVVLTTSKDRVKVQGRLDLPLAELPLACEPEAAFFSWLDRRLAEHVQGRGGENGRTTE